MDSVLIKGVPISGVRIREVPLHTHGRLDKSTICNANAMHKHVPCCRDVSPLSEDKDDVLSVQLDFGKNLSCKHFYYKINAL